MQGLKVNLIITDYSMPGMSGYDLLKTVKVSHYHPSPLLHHSFFRLIYIHAWLTIISELLEKLIHNLTKGSGFERKTSVSTYYLRKC